MSRKEALLIWVRSAIVAQILYCFINESYWSHLIERSYFASVGAGIALLFVWCEASLKEESKSNTIKEE